MIRIPRPGRVRAWLRHHGSPTPLWPRLVDAIAERYGIVPVGPGRRLSGRGRQLLLRTTGGAKVLRRYRADWPEASVLCEHSILRELARLGFPAVRLTIPLAGPSWLTLDGDRYALYDFVPGNDMSWVWVGRASRARLIHSAGELLGSYHVALRDFAPAARHHLDTATEGHGQIGSPFGWSQLVAKAEGVAGDGPHDGVLRRQIVTELERAQDGTRVTALPSGMIHGDYGLHNLRYHKAAPTLMDLELARSGSPLQDVAVALHRLCGGTARFDDRRAAAFLAAYEKVRPLSEPEWEALPDAWIHQCLRHAVRHFAARSGAGEHRTRQVRAALADVDWVQRNRARVNRLQTRP